MRGTGRHGGLQLDLSGAEPVAAFLWLCGTARGAARGTPVNGVPRHRGGAGDRDRTGMASLEGNGSGRSQLLVKRLCTTRRAFRALAPHGRLEERFLPVARRTADRVLRFAAPLLPTSARRSESLLSSPSGTTHRAGRAGWRPTAGPSSCDISGAGPRRSSVSPGSRPRQLGLCRPVACACRRAVRAAQRGWRQGRSRPSPGRPRSGGARGRCGARGRLR
jgi:hypothetical protein